MKKYFKISYKNNIVKANSNNDAYICEEAKNNIELFNILKSKEQNNIAVTSTNGEDSLSLNSQSSKQKLVLSII